MRNYLILILVLLILFSCKGQSSNNKDIEPSVVKSDTIQNGNEKINGIVYFSMDNGYSWKNASSGIPQNVRIGLGGVASSGKLLGIATKEYGVFIYNLNDNIWVKIPTEQRIIDGNIGALIFYKNAVYVGTQFNGIFLSTDKGKTWATRNSGLNNLTIRRFFEFENKLYVCTNGGFYVFDEKASKWKLEYRGNSLQVNGAAVFNELIYIASNKGVYRKDKDNSWENVLPDNSVHNISSDCGHLYAMTYSELLLTSKDGIHWQSMQEGLPNNMYTFNVLKQNEMVFAGQWDGIYRKMSIDNKWKKSSNGLPANFAVTNLKSFNGVLVITTSERKLK